VGLVNVNIIGGYQTSFGELWEKSIQDLSREAIDGVLKDAKIDPKKIDIIFVSSKLSGETTGQSHLGSLAAEILGINVPSFRVEAACASGGLATTLAYESVKTGRFKTALVLGVEKMTDVTPPEITRYLMQAGDSEKESGSGVTFPGIYAMMARSYIEKYNLSRERLSEISVKNHLHGNLNPLAHFQKEIKLEMAMNSAMVADPLNLFDCSGISDGAAAIILSSVGNGLDHPLQKKESVEIVGSGVASDTLSLQDRESYTEIKATRLAAKKAFQEAGIKQKDINLIELHDCFTIAEIMALEDMGFVEKGKYKTTKIEDFYFNSKLPVNTSGGLKACGHPVGATGVKQIVEVYKQLMGECGSRQVKNAKYGLTHNVGGSGGTAVVHILKKI
jgi:acetyl-CoA C-acetyltransferase